MSTTAAAAPAAAEEVPPSQQQQPPTLLPSLDASRAASLGALPFSFLVASASARDYPIVYCSPGFTELTGYEASEVLGKNCRFLQGPGTSRRKVAEIRDALREERACRVVLINYRKDGTPFWNLFHLSPVRDEVGEGGSGAQPPRTALYIGVQTDVTDLVEKARARRAAAKAEEEDDGGQGDEEAADAVAEGAAAAAEGDVRRLRRALSRTAIGGSAVAPAEDTSDEEEVAALGSLEEGEAGAVKRALGGEGGGSGDNPKSGANNAFPDVPARLLSHLFRVPSAFVLSDPRKPDCPIVFASEAFCRMTGYARDEVVGRNCRFLQQRHDGGGGDEESSTATTPNAAAEAASAAELARLREALAADPPKPATVTLLNYKKDGTPFWNALHVGPVRDADGRVEFYVGVQLDVTGGGGGAGGEEQQQARLSLPQRLAHSSTTGAVRVACRSLMGEAGGLRRSADWQALPKRGWCSKQQQQQQREQGGGGGGGGAA